MKPNLLLFAALVVFLFISPVFTQTSAVIITNNAPLREKPLRTARLVLILKKDTRVKLESSVNQSGWYRVSVEEANLYKSYKNYIAGKSVGWVFGNNLKLDVPEDKEVDQVLEWAKSLMDVTDKTKDEWVSVWKNHAAEYFFNPSKVVFNEDKRELWIKLIVSDKATYWKDFFQKLHKPLPDGFVDNYDMSMQHWLADCKTKRLGLIEQIDYDIKGDHGGFGDGESVSMSSVIPDTMGEEFWNKACAVK